MKITQISWPYDVPEKLKKACGDDFETIRNQVQDGICHLYKFESDGVDLLMVTRGEETTRGRELVVVCIGGVGIKAAGQFLIDNALKAGFVSIRYHVQNPVTDRLYRQFGGKEIDRVYQVVPKGVNDGR
ncbi:hypothetical protein [Marinomonas spartinae]|uniref:hypothetical protein n=1 Tax=Marinomonas spartinae TaxID=1792290 RepID=UPI0018F20154|nr:hypothetical protein [Marinomonas spartinae]MBJ7556559.1 hypothetical protein [Marinomonas spartinae]